MINKHVASEYFCEKDKRHHEVSASGQRKKCWLCGAKMIEIKRAVVTTKGAK
jgi:hypothetical protein